MVKNKALPDSAAHPGLVSLSLSHSLTLFILRVPLDPAGAGPRHPTLDKTVVSMKSGLNHVGLLGGLPK